MICPVCTQAELAVFFDAGELPVFVNVLYDTAEEARAATKGRIRLGGCPICGFVHNVDFDPEAVAYAPGYENSLHGSPTFQAWAEDLATGLVERHGLGGGHAVEVGGGRGEFMELLVEAGLGQGLVMDPSAPDDATGDQAGFSIERRLFETDDVRGGDDGTRLILSRHVLEHVQDPQAFVGLLGSAAREVGAGLYIEVPNGLWTLRDLGVWDVIYEHCSYFTPRSLRGLLATRGANARTAETYGGQFLGAEAESVGQPLDTESVFGCSSPQADEETALRDAFGTAHASVVDRWRGLVDSAKAEGQRMAIWGAGSKGATFLNTVDPEGVMVGAVDVNSRKKGKFIPGSGHAVMMPDGLGDARLDRILVMNPIYLDEIAGMARAAGSTAEVEAL